MTTLRGSSIKDWTGETLACINAGSLQRIADATEKMAVRHTELMQQRDMFERWYVEAREQNKLSARRLNAAKGQITKLRKALAAANEGMT